MPITETEHRHYVAALDKLKNPHELMRLTGLVYDMILAGKIKSEPLMALGKMIYSRTPWKDLVGEWNKAGGNPAALNQLIRLPMIRAAEEFLIPALKNVVFDVIPDPPAAEAPVAAAPREEKKPEPKQGELAGFTSDAESSPPPDDQISDDDAAMAEEVNAEAEEASAGIEAASAASRQPKKKRLIIDVDATPDAPGAAAEPTPPTEASASPPIATPDPSPAATPVEGEKVSNGHDADPASLSPSPTPDAAPETEA
jgi:hypothetical protein